MADLYWALQAGFSTGEVSPSMIARTDLPKLGMAALTLRNRTVLPHGPTEVRPGFEFIYPAKYGDKDAVLRPFVFSSEQAYVLEIGDSYIRFYKDGGVIYKPADEVAAWAASTAYAEHAFAKTGTTVYRCVVAHTSGASTEPGVGADWATKWVQNDVYEIESPYIAADVYDLNFTQSADLMYISHNSYPIQVLSRSGHATWTQADFAFEGGPFMKQNLTATTLAVNATTGTGKTLTSSVGQFQAGHVGSLWQVKHDVAGQVVSSTFSGTGSSTAVRGRGRWKVITNGTWTGKVNLEMSLDGVTWTIFRSYSSASNANVVDEEDSDGLASYRLTCTALSSGSITYDLTMQPHEWAGIVQITAVTNDTTATCTVVEELAATTATAKWCEGSWSDVRGWPACSAFYQNRFVAAGTPNQPATAWLSKNDDYTNFGKSSPLVDDDSVTLPLVTRQMNAIRSMVAMGSASILCFTSKAHFKLSAATSGVMTPSNAMGDPQEYYGVSNVDPIVTGDRVLYVPRNGRTLRDMGYQLTSDRYVGSEVSIMARHLFKQRRIIDMAYLEEPDNTLYQVRDDGVLLGLTYQRDQEVYAWHWHDTRGKFKSVATIPGATRNELWVLVERTINGQTVKYIERQRESVPTDDVKDMFYLDSGLTYDGSLKTDGTTRTITGATKANPVVITSAGHGLANGALVDISGVVGMTQINGQRYKVALAGLDTFALQTEAGVNVNGTAYTTYVSGGVASEAVLSVSGLPHLEGEVVNALADGFVVEGLTVTGGAVTMTRAANKIHIGIPYIADFESPDGDIPSKDGSTQGRTKTAASVILRLQDARGGTVGKDFTLMDDIYYGDPASYDVAMPLFDGDISMTVPGADWDTKGRVCIRQTQPLPLTIVAINKGLELGG